jgi:hypothetical protein
MAAKKLNYGTDYNRCEYYSVPQPIPVAWVTADTVDGQAVNGKPRRIWWENNEGVGIPIYTAPQPTPEVAKLVEALTTIRAMFPTKLDKHAFVVNGGPPLRTGDDDEFYSAKKVNALVNAIVSTVDGALAAHRKHGGKS